LFDIDVRLLAPIATLFGVTVSVYLWRLNQPRKILSYQVVSRQGLVSIRGPARKKVQVNFEGRAVENAQLVMIRIFNSGNKSINSGDYQTDLALCMNPEAEIVHADVAETTPSDLEERVRVKGEPAPLIKEIARGRLVLTPTLLNAGDEIVLQMLVNNLTEQIHIKGHIDGISAPRRWRQHTIVPTVMTNAGAIIMAIAMLCVDPSALTEFGWQEILPFILFFLLGYVFLWAGLYWPGRGRLALESVNN
jgi:hypothetical protein